MTEFNFLCNFLLRVNPSLVRREFIFHAQNWCSSAAESNKIAVTMLGVIPHDQQTNEKEKQQINFVSYQMPQQP